MKITNLIIIASTMISSTAYSESYDDRWHRLSEQYDNSNREQGSQYEISMIDVHTTLWDSAEDKCAIKLKTSIPTQFRAISIIDKEGIIKEFLLMPNRQEVSCYTKEMVGQQYPKPPMYPFLVRYTFNIPKTNN